MIELFLYDQQHNPYQHNELMKLKYINLDFVKPDKDCKSCDLHDDYTCFECESFQVIFLKCLDEGKLAKSS